MKRAVLIGLACFIFLVPLLQGEILFPGSFMQAWFEPWKSTHADGERIGVVHKPVADDVFRQIYPMKQLAADMIGHGQLPLWNPYNGAGQPLLATMHPGFFNPFSLFLTLFPGYMGWMGFVLGQLLVLTSGMYWYCRSLSLSKFASVFATASVVCSGFVTTRLVYGDYVYALAVVPWLLWSVERQKYAFTSFCIVFLIYCVQPQIIGYVILFFSIYVLERGVDRTAKIRFFIATVLGIGMSSIQLFPMLELYTLANVTPVSSSFIFSRFLLPFVHLISLVIPNYFGNAGTYNYWGAGDFVESMGSVGLVTCFVAFISLMKLRSNSLIKFFLVTIIVCIVLSLDSPFTQYMYGLGIPILSTGIPSRIFMMSTFAFSVLVGYGFSFWEQTSFSLPFSKKSFIAVLIVLLLIVGYTALSLITRGICPAQIPHCRFVAVRNSMFEVGIFCIVLIGIYAVTKAKDRFIRHKKLLDNLLGSMLLTGLCVTGLYHAIKFLPFSPSSSFYPPVPLLSFLQTRSDGRVMGVGSAFLSPNIATQMKIFDPNYYDPLYVRRYGELVSFANTQSVTAGLTRSDVMISSEVTPSAQLAQRRERLWDILQVKYIIEKKSELPQSTFGTLIWEDALWRVVERPSALPFVSYVAHAEITKDDLLANRLFSASFDPRQSVLLEHTPPSPIAGAKTDHTVFSIASRDNMQLSIIGTATQSGYLVISQAHYPGWRARVDTAEVPVFRANYALSAIQVPSGQHTISFWYDPISFHWGLLVQGVSGILFCVYVFITRKSNDTTYLTNRSK